MVRSLISGRYALISIAAALAFVGVIALSLGPSNAWWMSRRFANIVAGDSKEKVIDLLGNPKKEQEAKEVFIYSFIDNPSVRVRYCYFNKWSFIFPETEMWAVDFDNAEKVVETAHYMSP